MWQGHLCRSPPGSQSHCFPCLSFPRPPSPNPAPAGPTGARFKAGGRAAAPGWSFAAALFGCGGAGSRRLPELPCETATVKDCSLLAASSLGKNQPGYFVFPFFHLSPPCFPQHTLSKPSIINHSLLPRVRMGFLIRSKSFGEQAQLRRKRLLKRTVCAIKKCQDNCPLVVCNAASCDIRCWCDDASAVCSPWCSVLQR